MTIGALALRRPEDTGDYWSTNTTGLEETERTLVTIGAPTPLALRRPEDISDYWSTNTTGLEETRGH